MSHSLQFVGNSVLLPADRVFVAVLQPAGAVLAVDVQRDSESLETICQDIAAMVATHPTMLDSHVEVMSAAEYRQLSEGVTSVLSEPAVA